MLGDRFVQHFNNASPATLKDVVDRWRRGELPPVTEEPRLVGKGRTKLRIVRRGLATRDGTMVLHSMYFEAANFDPFFGPPDEQADIACYPFPIAECGQVLGEPGHSAGKELW